MISILSIIITVYNQSETIIETLLSINQQKSNLYQLIIINDGSTDDSEKMINEYLSQNKMDAKLIQTMNQGVSAARNLGLENSTGKYILFLDGDDKIHPNLISTIEKYYQSNFDLICFKYNQINEHNEIIESGDSLPQPKNTNQIGKDAFYNYIFRNQDYFSIWNSSIVYNRSLITKNNIRYSVNIQPGEDVEFQLKSIYLSDQILFLNKVLSSYRKIDGSSMNSYNLKRFDAFLAMLSTYNFIKRLNNLSYNRLINSALKRLINQTLNGFIYNYAWNLKYYFEKYPFKFKNKRFKNEIQKKYPNIKKMYRKYLFANLLNEISVSALTKKMINIGFLIVPFYISKLFIKRYKI